MKISVGMPIAKSKFLAEALRSWENQTYQDFEIFIVNDASKDDCDSIVRPFLEDERFHYIRRANSSFPYFVRNWNECLKYATGEWFVLASDDDVYAPTFLEEMLKGVDGLDVDLIHCRTMQLLCDGTIGKVNSLFPAYETQLEFINDIFVHARGILGQNFMSRTSRLKEIGGFVDVCVAWGSDYLTYAQLAKNGVAYCKSPLLMWRSSGENVSTLCSHRMRILKLIAGIETQSYWRNNILSKMDVLAGTTDVRMLNSCMLRLDQLECTFVADARAYTGTLSEALSHYLRCLITGKRPFLWFVRFWLLRYVF